MSTMNKSAPDRFEGAIDRIFEFQRKSVLQDAFDRLNPSNVKSPLLRSVLKKLNEMPSMDTTASHMSGENNDSFEAIVFLSNKVQSLMRFLDEEEREDLDAALCNAVIHISMVPSPHNIAHETSPPPPPPPQGPLQPELVTLSMENEALRQHIDSLERQLVHVKTEREKTAAAQRVIISQHSRDNSSLRANVGKARKDVEDMKKLCFEK